MKKKLLLSSVAALSLFAAYNLANAEEYGNFGERLRSETVKPEDPYTIEKAETAEEVEVATEKYAARQERAFALRVANNELNKAKELESSAKSKFDAAQKAFADATQKLADAVNTQYDAKEQKDKLVDVLASIKNRKDYDTNQLNETRQLLPDFETKAEQAAKDLAKAEETAEGHREQKPVSGAPADVLKQYNLEQIRFERNVEKAKVTKALADDALAKLKKDEKDLDAAIKKAEERINSLNDAISRLSEVVGNDTFSGKVRGVLVEELQKELKLKQDELGYASEVRVYAASERKAAEKAYDLALKAAQDVYKAQGVEFVLSDVLAIAEPTGTYVTKFGWNQDKDGNWVYLKDSEGHKATGWVNENGSWYYLDPTTGVMQKWWVKVDGTWYFLNGTGAMQTGWLQDNGTWYYLEASGAMKANQWFEVDGKWYHVDEKGALSVNTTVDGYNVNENGEWV